MPVKLSSWLTEIEPPKIAVVPGTGFPRAMVAAAMPHSRYTGPSMDLANMRAQGVRSLSVRREVYYPPGEIGVPQFEFPGVDEA